MAAKKKTVKKTTKKTVVRKPKNTGKIVSGEVKNTAPIKEEVSVKEEAKVDVSPIQINEVSSSFVSDRNIPSPYIKPNYNDYLNKLNDLRRDGENKVIALKNEIRDILLNKQIDKETKRTLVDKNKDELRNAKSIAKEHKKAVTAIVNEAMHASNIDFKNYFGYVKDKANSEIREAKFFYHDMRTRMKEEHLKKISEIKANAIDKKALKLDLKAESIAYSSRVNEAKTACNDAIDSAKQFKYNSFMNKYGYTAKIKNDKHPINEWLQFKYQHYIANFNLTNWIIKNALYVVILLIFIALVGVTGGKLLSGDSILTALVQISPKIFFALGVAGLILLAGTDLSIGRLTGVGVSFTLMILSTDVYKDINGVPWWTGTAMAPAGKVVMALLVSIILCTFFTTFAGFFTAKFKMHPFISTLAVQLISYGFFQIFWSATSSFTPDENIINALRGPQSVLLIVYAAIAIIIVWFIWNKTKFGKNMYAVGGNQEAATVSGINPFTITLLAFVMAGILYGFGGFVQAIQTGTGNFNSGYGTETDAIAACVIGGISFSGGVGKVSGAVLGAIILGFLTHAFSFMGVNSNLQLLIKGVIILVAVALDCVKYLRKK